MAELVITNDNFETEVLNSDVPVLVDFWASWCGPCRMLSPIISEIAEENEGKFKVGKLNVDENEELADKYNVMAIPTMLCFVNGEVKGKLVGVNKKEDIVDFVLK